MEERLKLLVTDAAVGQRLDAFLAREVPAVSRARAKRLLTQHRVRVGGRDRDPDYRLRPGEMVEVALPSEKPALPLPEPIPLSVVHEDRDLLVIDKPPGILVHPKAEGEGGTLLNALLHRTSDLSLIGGPWRRGIVHRLDRDTSGLLLVAKNDRAHGNLIRQFKARLVEKEYRAVVLGSPPRSFGKIDFPIGRSVRRRTRMVVKYAGGRPALTEYELLESFESASLLRLLLRTGRTHQIRIHLSRLGCPVLGDREYGQRGRELSRRLGIRRQMLHAFRLRFRHPVLREYLEFRSPLPEDMENVLRLLRGGAEAREG